MPAVEIADAIVQTGRETLEKVRQVKRPFISVAHGGLGYWYDRRDDEVGGKGRVRRYRFFIHISSW